LEIVIEIYEENPNFVDVHFTLSTALYVTIKLVSPSQTLLGYWDSHECI